MAIAKDALIAQINNLIKANGAQQITGPILNGILREMTNSLTSPYFLFPKHSTLSTNDIGKVVMNDGSNTAKVYAYSPATFKQNGKWTITLSSLDDLNDQSQLNISNQRSGMTVNREEWRQGLIPETVSEELNMMGKYISGKIEFSLSHNISGNMITFIEKVFNTTTIRQNNFPDGALQVITPSAPALPAAPTAFPLGKLIGIDGNNAMISSNSVETYTVEGSITLNPSFFSSIGNINTSDPDKLYEEMMQFIIIPAEGGGARALKKTDIQPAGDDKMSLENIRQQFLGVAIEASGGFVKVYDLKQFSLIASVFLNLVRKDVINP